MHDIKFALVSKKVLFLNSFNVFGEKRIKSIYLATNALTLNELKGTEHDSNCYIHKQR